MSRKNFLAKILFLFFAVISLGLVTVSCSDDDDDDAKTTTNTTQEEDDEDLDSIPIEEMTLEQRRKVFIGSWECLYDDEGPYKDTITFYKDGLVKQTWGYFNGARFELSDSVGVHRIIFNIENTRARRNKFVYTLERYEGDIYVTFQAFATLTDDLMIHNEVYKKIK